MPTGVMKRDSCVAVVQARVDSVRFPRKVVAPILGKPAILHLLDRLSRARFVDQIVLAVPDTPPNEELAAIGRAMGVWVSAGSEGDVLRRFAQVLDDFDFCWVARITGDCPLVEPTLVDRAISEAKNRRLDFVETDDSFGDGFDVEVFSAQLLKLADSQASSPYDREHVTPYIKREAVRVASLSNESIRSQLRVTLDEPEDLVVVRNVFEHFGHNHFSVSQVENLMDVKPELFLANRHLSRNEGGVMTTGQKLWRRATNPRWQHAALQEGRNASSGSVAGLFFQG